MTRFFFDSNDQMKAFMDLKMAFTYQLEPSK